MTTPTRRALLYAAIVALAGAVACVIVVASCSAAEPPRLYLPAVLLDMPAMSSEYDPVQPVPTVTPEPPTH